MRRLSPAVQQASSLLAVAPTPDGSLQLWGLLFSEHQWDQLVDQPRLSPARPPRALLVQVSGPGNIVFYDGAQRVLTLQRGRIEGHGFVSFPKTWAEGRFTENRALAGDSLPGPVLTAEQDELLVHLTLQMQRRALTRIRTSGHGALMVLMPTDRRQVIQYRG